MISRTRRLYDWMGSTIYSPHAPWVLGFLFYIEAIFFLPTDPILIIYCIERQKKSFFYASIATFASVLGGVTSYWLGYYLWNTVGEQIIYNSYLNYFFKSQTLLHAMDYYRQYQVGAILIAGFTPIPYKVATLTAGFCSFSMIPFIICSAIARGARFYLLAAILYWYGERIKNKIDHYVMLIVLLTVTTIFLTYWLVKW